jgi:transposase
MPVWLPDAARRRGYQGSYETVKRFVAPLREQAAAVADLCQRRFETAPGQQSQIDWGQAGICLRSRPVVLHIFVMTLGYSRRGYCRACANEQLGL